METVQPIQNTGMIVVSPPNAMIEQDWRAVGKKMAVFAAPLVLLYTSYVTNNLSDGFAWSDLVPNMILAGSIIYWIMTTLTEIFSRYIGSPKYRV